MSDDSAMRLLAVVAALVVVAVSPAAAAGLDPATLVLRKSDVPRGYTVLRANTGYLTYAKAVQGNRDLLRRFVSWGRLTGYAVEYDGGLAGTIASRADVFAKRNGAQGFLAWFVLQTPQTTGLTLVRSVTGLGERAFVYSKDFGSTEFVVVAWRFRNVFAYVGADSLGKQRTIALAHVQQRRIVAALR